MERSRRNLIIVAVLLGFLIVLLAIQNRGGTEGGGSGQIAWLTELPPALATAKETGKPIMVDFFATWCGPCKMLDKQTYSDDRVAAASTNWLMVRIDVDKNPALAQQYAVSSIPTIVTLGSDGKELQREIGFIGVGPMLTFMEKSAARNPAVAGAEKK